jgi:outer membrane protein TolC
MNTEFPLKDYWLGGVSLRWELFSGFRIQGEEREARSKLKKMQAEIKELELSVIQEVSRAFIGVLESSETIETARVTLEEAKENMALAQGRHGEGLSNSIEFADAELILTEARSDFVQATYQYLQNYARLEHAAGGIGK